MHSTVGLVGAAPGLALALWAAPELALAPAISYSDLGFPFAFPFPFSFFTSESAVVLFYRSRGNAKRRHCR